jgi:serine/threonine protein kinase
VHRDLATRNILVMKNTSIDGDTTGLVLKICDFGLSRVKNKVNIEGDVYYRPPVERGLLNGLYEFAMKVRRKTSDLVVARSFNGQ